jgi:hypothetical protein
MICKSRRALQAWYGCSVSRSSLFSFDRETAGVCWNISFVLLHITLLSVLTSMLSIHYEQYLRMLTSDDTLHDFTSVQTLSFLSSLTRHKTVLVTSNNDSKVLVSSQELFNTCSHQLVPSFGRMCSLLVGDCIRISDDVAPADIFTEEVVKLDVVLNFSITSFLLWRTKQQRTISG